MTLQGQNRIPVAIPINVGACLTRKAKATDQKLREAARPLEASRGKPRIDAKGLRVPTVRTTETGAAITFTRRVAIAIRPSG